LITYRSVSSDCPTIPQRCGITRLCPCLNSADSSGTAWRLSPQSGHREKHRAPLVAYRYAEEPLSRVTRQGSSAVCHNAQYHIRVRLRSLLVPENRKLKPLASGFFTISVRQLHKKHLELLGRCKIITLLLHACIERLRHLQNLSCHPFPPLPFLRIPHRLYHRHHKFSTCSKQHLLSTI
jgi:hypothetical protein